MKILYLIIITIFFISCGQSVEKSEVDIQSENIQRQKNNLEQEKLDEQRKALEEEKEEKRIADQREQKGKELAEQLNPKIDEMFAQWAESWGIDRYDNKSAIITDVQDLQNSWSLKGTFYFYRLGDKKQGEFTATYEEKDDKYRITNLCYDYNGEKSCL